MHKQKPYSVEVHLRFSATEASQALGVLLRDGDTMLPEKTIKKLLEALAQSCFDTIAIHEQWPPYA